MNSYNTPPRLSSEDTSEQEGRKFVSAQRTGHLLQDHFFKKVGKKRQTLSMGHGWISEVLVEE